MFAPNLPPPSLKLPGPEPEEKTESDDGNKFTSGRRNSISCEEEPTRIQ